MTEKGSRNPTINEVIIPETRPTHSGLPDTGILDPDKMPVILEKKQPFVERAVGTLAQALDDLFDKSGIGK